MGFSIKNTLYTRTYMNLLLEICKWLPFENEIKSKKFRFKFCCIPISIRIDRFEFQLPALEINMLKLKPIIFYLDFWKLFFLFFHMCTDDDKSPDENSWNNIGKRTEVTFFHKTIRLQSPAGPCRCLTIIKGHHIER